MSLKKKVGIFIVVITFGYSVFSIFSDLNSLVFKKHHLFSLSEEARIINSKTLPVPPSCLYKTKGDADCDDEIGFNDFWILKSEFLTSTLFKKSAPYNGWSADFNQDKKVNLQDFSILLKNCFRVH